MFKTYSFPHKYQEQIGAALSDLGFSLSDTRPLAAAIKKLSDHYQLERKVTPWNDPEMTAAYLTYFFPLNYIRNLKVFSELAQHSALLQFRDFVDFGFGLGSGFLAARDAGVFGENHRLHALDVSSTPLDLFQKYLAPVEFKREFFPSPGRAASGVFSYSLNELTDVPKWFFSLETIVLLEPSTSQWGRKLMQWREPLREKGYTLWAPCTHQKDCPLLLHSKKDWCHDRVHWEQPDWFSEIEKHLPMKNQTLTHSYLIASKIPQATENPHRGRVVGDELKEKGKSRWLFCRGEDREFLSWLNKQGPSPQWHRGECITPHIDAVKGNEIRLKPC